MAQSITVQIVEGVTSVSTKHFTIREEFRMVPCNLGTTGTGDAQMGRLNVPTRMKHELDEGGEEK